MLITAAVVPGAPALVPELMGSAAPELDDLRRAADSLVSRAVSDLVASSADSPSSGAPPAQLVVVGPGQPGEFNAAGPVSFGSFGRNFTIPALVLSHQSHNSHQSDQSRPSDQSDPSDRSQQSDPSGRSQQSDPSDPSDPSGRSHQGDEDGELPTPLMVARYLASRHIAAYPEHADLWASARWITTSGADASALGQSLRTNGTLIALILVADGAACHGPKAPRAEDSRANAYDEGVCAALESGQPDRLAQIDVELGRELGATGPQVWPVLFTAEGGAGIGEVAWRGAPYGVGWTVAGWRPAQHDPIPGPATDGPREQQ